MDITMQPCSPDFQPLIVAIATLLSVQVPLLVGLAINQYKIKHDVAVNKSLNYTIDRKTDIQTVILKNGFHGPPGPVGPAGKDGSDCNEQPHNDTNNMV